MAELDVSEALKHGGSHQQSIIRFQGRSFILPTTDASCILPLLSNRTGWPMERLELSSLTLPFGAVRVVSSLLGGKGGFGTLLKGQSRQAGANTTTNFGACRDLQGRRLRHVNESIEGRVWQEWKQRIEAGTATEEEMAQALLKTDSGVVGWHLQLPAWADVSAKKEQRKWKRKLHKWKRERKALAAMKEEKRRLEERHVQAYVEKAEEAIANVQSSLDHALQAGLLERDHKRTKSEPEPPAALITLAGEVVLAQQGGRWLMQSKSNFCTVGAVLEPQLKPQILYYEIVIVSGGIAQVGWASAEFKPTSESGDGVGDCKYSWGYDGSRQIRLHNGKTNEYGTKIWSENDVIGCHYNMMTREVWYTINGESLGVAFECPSSVPLLSPALSLNPEEIVELRFDAKDMSYLPNSITAVGDVLEGESVNFDETDDYENVENSSAEQISDDGLEAPKKVGKGGSETNFTLEPVDLSEFNTSEELEQLGPSRLKGALMALNVKCGGTLQERASRLFSLKGLREDEFPKKLLVKKRKA